MAQDDEKTPKRGRPRKSTRKSTRKESEEPVENDKEYKDKIRKALQANLMDFAKKKNLSQKQVTVINSFIEEHLSCFILLGYTTTGEPVTVVNAPTTKDSDSLGTLIQKFLVKYTDPPPNPLFPGY